MAFPLLSHNLNELPYPTRERRVDLGILSIKLLLVADMNQINRTGLNLDDPPYWAELWPSAVGLARSLIERQNLSGMRVLEVGCGLGLPGIAAAKAGASVLLTDANPDALAFALLNAQRNGCRNIATLRFNWATPPLTTPSI